MTLGLWGSSFLITEKGIDAAAAAQWVSLYWGGLTAGRLVSGFLAIRFNNQQMIRIGELTVLLGVVCLLLPCRSLYVSSALFWLELAALQFILVCFMKPLSGLEKRTPSQ